MAFGLTYTGNVVLVRTYWLRAQNRAGWHIATSLAHGNHFNVKLAWYLDQNPDTFWLHCTAFLLSHETQTRGTPSHSLLDMSKNTTEKPAPVWIHFWVLWFCVFLASGRSYFILAWNAHIPTQFQSPKLVDVVLLGKRDTIALASVTRLVHFRVRYAIDFTLTVVRWRWHLWRTKLAAVFIV
jgi:hypothetical protein